MNFLRPASIVALLFVAAISSTLISSCDVQADAGSAFWSAFHAAQGLKAQRSASLDSSVDIDYSRVEHYGNTSRLSGKTTDGQSFDCRIDYISGTNNVNARPRCR